MRGKHNNHAKAEKQHRWSDERMIAKNGYAKLRVGHHHPLADPNGYAYEHLVIWCAAGRSKPGRGLVLHHKNENKLDNRLANLEMTTRAEHNRLHNVNRPRDPATGRLGKSRAGRILNGVEHNAMPGRA